MSAIKQRDPNELAAGYTTWVRVLDIACVLSFLALIALLAYRVRASYERQWPLMMIAMLVAYVFADFISGLFHWMGDTWGSPRTPFLGTVFVRPFREHHVDQKSITRHDFFEVNGANCLISMPFALGIQFFPLALNRPLWVLAATFIGTFVFWIFTTNQFHSWAHADQPPKLARRLQRLHLILPPEHHQIHHKAPYSKYYCITSGWLNQPLDMIGFFPLAEKVVSAVTGLLPRQDDIGTDAAAALIKAAEQEKAAETADNEGLAESRSH